MKRKSKRIELTLECIKYFAKKAIDNNSTFKPFVEKILEEMAVNQQTKTK